MAATLLYDPSVAVLLVRPKGKPIVDQTLDVTDIEDVAGKPLWITYTNGARYPKARRDVQLLTGMESEPLPHSAHLHHTAWRDRVSAPATILRFAGPESSWLRPVLDDGTHLPAVPESEIITVVDTERPAETEAVLEWMARMWLPSGSRCTRIGGTVGGAPFSPAPTSSSDTIEMSLPS